MADGVGDEIEFFPDVLVPLPALQSMAQVVEGENGFEENCVVNITNTWDGYAYCVVWNAAEQKVDREGWLSQSKLKDLTSEKYTVETAWRLPFQELLRYTTIAEVVQDYAGDGALTVREGDLVQISHQADGWVFGTILKDTYREVGEHLEVCRESGWIPSFVLDPKQPPCVLDLCVEERQQRLRQEKLSDAAAMQLLELLNSCPPTPDRLQIDWPMPPVVEQSYLAGLEILRQPEESAAAQETPEVVEEQNDEEEFSRPRLIEPREPAEENCPLYHCVLKYTPPKSQPDKVEDDGYEHLLPLDVGDVVRVVCRIEQKQKWLHGYVDNPLPPDGLIRKGWFPTSCVQKLDHGTRNADKGRSPLQLLQAGRPPRMPQVPEHLVSQFKSER